MARVLVVVVVILSLFALAPMAVAAQNQPGQGETSTGRNAAGFGGGPHCHILIVDSAQTQFDSIRVFPSHTGHASSSNAGVFTADGDCDGD